jgi:hypothetical protein
MKLMHSPPATSPLLEGGLEGERSPARERGRVRGFASIRYIVIPSPQPSPLRGYRVHAFDSVDGIFGDHCQASWWGISQFREAVQL